MDRAQKDILLDENFDISFENGDIKIGESFWQEVILVLNSEKGMWKSSPLTGAGLRKNIRSTVSPENIKKEIQLALQAENIKLTNNEFSQILSLFTV